MNEPVRWMRPRGEPADDRGRVQSRRRTLCEGDGIWETADLEEVYNTERHLLYVACTQARDHLLVTSVDPPSEFLDDLRM